MQKIEFNAMIVRLCGYFERKAPVTNETLDLWYGLVKYIPAECLIWIEKKMKEECDGWPRNIGMVVRDLYETWLVLNPEKRAITKEGMACPDCADGLIFVTRKKNGVNYHFVFGCSICRQATLGIPTASAAELAKQGYAILR